MPARSLGIAVPTAALLLGGCGSGSSSSAAGTAPGAPAGSGSGGAARTRGPLLTDWPEFGLGPQRLDATNRPTGITAANVGHLRRRRISLRAPSTPRRSTCTASGCAATGTT
ncbi:MAG: hypothetical protein U0R71_08390 [Solirubrobacterales bacterium]